MFSAYAFDQAKRTRATKIRNERGDITIDIEEIKRIIRESYGQLYAR